MYLNVYVTESWIKMRQSPIFRLHLLFSYGSTRMKSATSEYFKERITLKYRIIIFKRFLKFGYYKEF